MAARGIVLFDARTAMEERKSGLKELLYRSPEVIQTGAGVLAI